MNFKNSHYCKSGKQISTKRQNNNMRKLSLVFAAVFAVACKTEPKKDTIEPMVQMEKAEETMGYPESLTKVFDAHGGLDTWRGIRTLSYEMPKTSGAETHTIDLWSRKDRVDTDQYSMGFDGTDVWLLDANDTYTGDAAFYHNLMFYFYAMPFVLADGGIIYSETDPLTFDGVSYPGIRISYEKGVGTSSKDEYFIHYDPETFKMAWLGYTVTYRTGEISDNVKWIRYDDWQTVGELVLPKSVTWYNYEGRKILDARSNVPFERVELSKESKPNSFYEKPDNAVVVEVNKS